MIATAVAAVELVLLVAAGIVLIARPLSGHVQQAAKKEHAAPAKAKAVATTVPTVPKKESIGKPRLGRAETPVLVLNGNGETGAAGLEATLVRSRGYPVTEITDASRTNFARSIVMYPPGLRAEGARLAKDLGISLFSPLDGLRPAALGSAKLAVIVGRR